MGTGVLLPAENSDGKRGRRVRTFLVVLDLVVAIGLIVAIMLQPSKGEGLGSIGGGAQLFFRKAKGWEQLLERATTVLAVLFMAISVLLVVVR